MTAKNIIRRISDSFLEFVALIRRKLHRFRHRQNIILMDDEAVTMALEQTGIQELLQKGTALCSGCGTAVSIDNLAGWVRQTGIFYIFCNKPQCQVVLEIKGG